MKIYELLVYIFRLYAEWSESAKRLSSTKVHRRDGIPSYITFDHQLKLVVMPAADSSKSGFVIQRDLIYSKGQEHPSQAGRSPQREGMAFTPVRQRNKYKRKNRESAKSER